MGYCEFAMLQHNAGPDEKAFATLTKSIAILDKLVESEPGKACYHAEMGRSWSARGYLRDELRENDQAIPAFEKAIKEFRTAVAQSPDDNAYKASLSLSLENLGEQYLDLGQVSKGLQHRSSPGMDIGILGLHSVAHGRGLVWTQIRMFAYNRNVLGFDCPQVP